MTEEQPLQPISNQTTGQETVKTSQDLALEKLTARLDALESENRELRNANQGLWAELHPVTTPVQPAVTPEPVKGADTDYDVFVKKIGLKEE